MLIARLRVGGSVKLGSIEVGAVIATPARIEKAEQSRTARSDDGRRQRERADYYDRARRVMLVHRLSPSTEEGQLYDILIYVVPAIQGSLASVAQVEYFFGAFGWKNQIFTAFDRSRGFPVLTAAYGPFLCTAEVTFTDGVSVMLHRFIDFEMGNLVTYAADFGAARTEESPLNRRGSPLTRSPAARAVYAALKAGPSTSLGMTA